MSGNYVGYEPAPPGVVLVGDTNPIGTIAFFHKVPDASWLQINGQNLAKATYPDLWVYATGLLTADQTANPGLFKDINATTFALPKFDGLFLRALGQVDVNRSSAGLGIRQNDDNKLHSHTQNYAVQVSNAGSAGPWFLVNNYVGALTGDSGGPEARPVNVALIPCIKALKTLLVPAGTIAPAYTFASAVEVATGTEAAKAVAPSTQGSHNSAVKAWCNFNGTGVVAIRGSYNIASITDNAVGDFTMNYTTPMANANYAATCISRGGAGSGGVTLPMTGAAPTATQFRFLTHTISNTVPWNSAGADADIALFTAIGNL